MAKIKRLTETMRFRVSQRQQEKIGKAAENHEMDTSTFMRNSVWAYVESKLLPADPIRASAGPSPVKKNRTKTKLVIKKNCGEVR